jgi:uncharacterized protein (TIGR02284 family)
MEKNNEKTIDELNKLVEINNDRIEGYKTASEETDDAKLKTMFADLSHTSDKCREELAAEIRRLGGTPKKGTATTGKMYRAWMDIRSALNGKDPKAILKSCETGEDVAVDAYKDMLDKCSDNMPDQKALIQRQYNMIKADHDKVKQHRDELVNV